MRTLLLGAVVVAALFYLLKLVAGINLVDYPLVAAAILLVVVLVLKRWSKHEA